MSPDLQALGPNSNVNVIVQYYNPPNGNELNAGGLIGATNGKSLGLVKAYSWRLRSHVGAMPPTKKPRARKSNPGGEQRGQHDGAGDLPFPTPLHRAEDAGPVRRGDGHPSGLVWACPMQAALGRLCTDPV